MQSNNKELYRLTAERTKKSEILYKDIGTTVFDELYKLQKRPKSLRIRLKGVGVWFLRKQRMKIMVELFPPDLERVLPEDLSRLELYKYENRIEVYNLFKERLKEYDEYLELRNSIRKIRYATQKLMEPPKEEEESNQSSQDNPS